MYCRGNYHTDSSMRGGEDLIYAFCLSEKECDPVFSARLRGLGAKLLAVAVQRNKRARLDGCIHGRGSTIQVTIIPMMNGGVTLTVQDEGGPLAMVPTTESNLANHLSFHNVPGGMIATAIFFDEDDKPSVRSA